MEFPRAYHLLLSGPIGSHNYTTQITMLGFTT